MPGMRGRDRCPYIAHLLRVTNIALEYAATEEEAIAALRPLERDAQSNAMNSTLTMAQIVDCADMIKCFYAPGRVSGIFPAKKLHRSRTQIERPQ